MLAHPTKAARDVMLRGVQRDTALQISSAHALA
jgi:hypothetical protein